MTHRVSAAFAKDWGDAHECNKNNKELQGTPSSNMDLHNNGVGRNLELQNPKGDCWGMCKDDANDPNGQLCWIVNPPQGKQCSGN
jgi:hypothetical protein